MSEKIEIKTIASPGEISNRQKLTELHKANPLPAEEQVANSALFVKRQELSKMLFLHHLYLQFQSIPGILVEFGVRWGQNLVTLSNLRGILEPYSYGRKIVGFDTFEGFVNVDQKDGSHPIIKDGAFSVTKHYENYLEELMTAHQAESPLNHLKKFELRKGDAVKEFNAYLEVHPETIVAFAYFDFDIYKPTKDCLQLLLPLMPKGAIIGFDELVDPQFPGETLALKEVMKLRECRLFKNPYGGLQSYIILD